MFKDCFVDVKERITFKGKDKDNLCLKIVLWM